MIEIVLAHDDLARLRFAHSPVFELVMSLKALQEPAKDQMYGPWSSAVRDRLHGADMELFSALLPPSNFIPDFVIPTPSGPWGVLADELDAVRAAPPALVRSELEFLYADRPLPAVLRPLHDDPPAHLPAVAGAMHRYWQKAVTDVWPRLRALCQADLSYRVELFASAGIARVLNDLHDELTLKEDRLLIHKSGDCSHNIDMARDGILLIPCAFTWPRLLVGCCDVEQTMIAYPPRGLAELWAQPASVHADSLSALLGRTRAMMVVALDLPTTTTQLAVRLGVSPSTVSEHLKILKDTGLVRAQRRGRAVLYQRTDVAAELLEAVRSGVPDG